MKLTFDSPNRMLLDPRDFSDEDINYLKTNPAYLKLFTLELEEEGTPYIEKENP